MKRRPQMCLFLCAATQSCRSRLNPWCSSSWMGANPCCQVQKSGLGLKPKELRKLFHAHGFGMACSTVAYGWDVQMSASHEVYVVDSGIKLIGQMQKPLTASRKNKSVLYMLTNKSLPCLKHYWLLCLSSCLCFSSVPLCLHWVQGVWRHDDDPERQLPRHQLCWLLHLL